MHRRGTANVRGVNSRKKESSEDTAAQASRRDPLHAVPRSHCAGRCPRQVRCSARVRTSPQPSPFLIKVTAKNLHQPDALTMRMNTAGWFVLDGWVWGGGQESPPSPLPFLPTLWVKEGGHPALPLSAGHTGHPQTSAGPMVMLLILRGSSVP